jgi:hypothetical protein
VAAPDFAVGKDAFVIRMPVRAALMALCLALPLVGCGRSTPVAKIGDHTVTVADFLREANGDVANVPGPPETAKAMLLHELVQRQLVSMAAHAHGIDTLQATRKTLEQTSNRMLMQALYTQLAPTDVGVSEGEARAFYASRSQKADTHIIYAGDPKLIQMAKAMLDGGMPFAEVANRVNPPNALPPGGAMGMMSPGDLFEPLDEALRTQPVGVVGGPWETPRGWFMMKLTSRTKAEQPPFESQRSTYEEQLRRRKFQQAVTTALLALEHERHLTVSDPGGALLFRYLTPARVADAPHWTPDAAERRETLATWDGGRYTLGDAVDDLQSTETRGPEAGSMLAIHAWIQSQSLARISLAEAKRRHLDQEPAYVKQLDDARWNYLAQADVSLALSHDAPVSDAEVRAEWDKMRAMYPQVHSAHVVWVAAPDTNVANQLRNRAAPGASLAEVAHAIDPRLVVHDEQLKLPRTEPEWGEFQTMVAQMPPGAWSPPIYTGTEWRVIQLLDKVEAPIEFDQLSPAQQQQLTRNLNDRARQAHYTAYLDSLWNANHPVLMPENLKNVPWPPPSIADATP